MTPFRDIERRRTRAKSSYRDPKKHYVRIHGWLPVFQRYAKERRGQVRYLTLCAKSAIDVRYFRQKGYLPFDSQEKKYPTVTFIEQDAQDYATIAETLGTTNLGLKGSLEEILLEPTKVPSDHQVLMAAFPYDIVNLDFTGDVVPDSDPPYSSTIRAIERIILAQHEAGVGKWHLFLTFRALSTTANDEANSQLQQIVSDNLNDSDAKVAYGARPEPATLLTNDYKEFLRVGMSKFLAHSAAERGYALSLEGSYFYPRRPQGGGVYHIVKLVVGFSAIRQSGHLRNPTRAQNAYKTSVIQIFQSAAVDVYRQLGQAGELTRVQSDFQPVHDELEQVGLNS